MVKNSNPPILQVDQLSVVVEDKQVVNQFSLELKPAECHVLMGPNGSGKSSLANALAGHPQYQVTHGTVILGNLDLLTLSPDERALQGLMLAFQNPIEVPGLKVWQFLWQAYQQHFAQKRPNQGKKITKALEFIQYLEQLMKQVGLPPEMLKRGLNEGFSGGEKKRLELLQLLTLEPRVAILDETDSGLDLDAIKIVGKVIAQLQKKYQTACLVITHYQRLLANIKPDKLHILINGQVVRTGGAELVKEIEQSGYAQFKVNKNTQD